VRKISNFLSGNIAVNTAAVKVTIKIGFSMVMRGDVPLIKEQIAFKEEVRKMTSFYIKKLSKFFLIILLVILTADAYSAGGKLTGRVTEKQSGDPVIYANITITHIVQQGKEVNLPMPLGAVSDLEGYYVVLNIPPGEYTVRASMVGYQTIILKEVRIDPDRTILQNFNLEEGSIELGEVVVTATRELIKADVSGTQVNISSDRIESLPMIRVDEYLGKLKGVQLTSTADGYGLSVRGGEIRETDIRMDGISLQDPRSGNSYLGFNSTSLEEIQLISGGFAAMYGGIRSGILDVKTKDGNKDRFTASVKTTYTPEGQYRFFGTNPFSNDSWIYKIYAGEYAYTGVPQGTEGVPVELSDFRGWSRPPTTIPELRALDSLQRYELWQLQHPQYGVANRPDYIVEGTFTGPVPLPHTTFMTAFKYENSQFFLPLGPRNNYVDWNGQLKFTTSLENMKFSVNGMYAKIFSNTSAQSVGYDAAQRFAYLNNNSNDGVDRQASLIAGQGILNIFNKSRLQEFEQTYIMGGARFTHVPVPQAFYTIDFQVGYTGQDITPMLMDMTKDSLDNYIYMYSEAAKRWFKFFYPTTGLPNGSTNPTGDGLNKFNMYGGHQWADSSYSYNYQLKGDLTWQANRFNQLQTGFSASIQNISVYAGSWNQSATAFTPNSWQYYKGNPLELGLYVQDKMEYEGMILNIGLRADYFNSMKDKYEVGFPSDKDYANLYTNVYSGLEGSYNSYEKWLLFRGLLEDPPGWPSADNKGQLKLAPRLGVSFPITEVSKMYFNFGHFYQRPSASLLYNMKLNAGSTIIPTPDLEMAKTISYEFGYEQVILTNYLFNATAYYKDVSNNPMLRTFVDWYETNSVAKYYPDAYRDIRGVELRFERNFGRYFTFQAMYDYMLVNSGQAGYVTIYENMVKYRENRTRTATQVRQQPRPRANVNLNLNTPDDFGLLLGNWFTNFFFEWRDGGEVLLNQDQTLVTLQNWVEAVNYWNIDFRLTKQFYLIGSNLEISLIVKNLTNNKWLTTAHMTQAESSEYRIQLEENGGKWGEYKPDHLAKVFDNSWENVLFLNPRRVIFGVRVNL
jgi:outer membrane cobalamin receptor